MEYDADRRRFRYSPSDPWFTVTPMEGKALAFGLAHAGHALSYDELGQACDSTSRGKQLQQVVRVLMGKINSRIGRDLFVAIRGYGYVLLQPAEGCATCRGEY